MDVNGSLGWIHPALDQCRDVINNTEVESWTKRSHREDRERVTNIDLLVERVLLETISRRHPSAAILTEESNPNPAALEQPSCFVVDPIDGTDEFVAGRHGYAVLIAFYENGRPVSAIMDMPALDRRFECGPTTPTTMNGEPITLPDVSELHSARIAVSASQHKMDSLRSYWDSLGARTLVPTPAFAAKFGAVLSGDCDAALYLPIHPLRTAIWDYAAPALLLRMAGGKFTNTEGADLLQESPMAYQGGWLASSVGLQPALLEVVRRLANDAS